MRKSDYPKVHRRGVAGMIILLLLLLLLGAFAPAAMAQTWPNCDWYTNPNCTWGCTADDVEINRAYLGYCNNSTALPETCTAGTPINACIWAEFHCKSTARTQIYTFFNLTIDGDYNGSYCDCIDNMSAHTSSTRKIYGTLNWTCGQEIKLENITVSWETTGKCNCSDRAYCKGGGLGCKHGTSQCWGGNITVRTPLSANFTHTAPQCYCTDINFYGTATGGEKPYVNWSWDFGDGNSSTGQNTSHHYGTNINRTYNVTLTVNDSGSPKNTSNISKNVTVWPTPVANFTTNSPQIYCHNITFNDTSTGGTPSYTWDWKFGDGGTSTEQNTSHHYSAPGTYNVTLNVTDVHNCTNSTTKQVEVTIAPSISVNKTGNVTEGAPSTDVNYTLTVTNSGDCALNVTAVDTLPANMTYVSSIPAGTQSPTGTITWDLGSIASGAPATTIYMVAHIEEGASGLLNNTVHVEGKPSHGDNVTDDDYYVITALGPAITVTKTGNVTEGAPSTDVNYTLTVTNSGDCALNVTAVDTLPANMTYVSSIPAGTQSPTGTITWDLGSIASGTPATTIYMVAHIEEGASGLLNNTVHVEGKPSHGDNVTDDDYYVITALGPAITVTKTGNVTEGAPSTDVNYTLTVTNSGDCALNVTAVDTLPANMTYVSSIPAGTQSPTGTITWDLGSIASGTPATTIYMVAHIEEGASGLLNNTVHVEGKPSHGDNVTDDDYYVITALGPAITVTKTGNVTEGAPSTDVNYTLTVTNSGDCALNVTAVDTLPANMTYVSSIPAGTQSPTGTITWDLGSIASGTPATTIYMVAHIEEGASGLLNNTVHVEGKPSHGDNVTDDDYYVITALGPAITVTKTGNVTEGAPSTDVNYTLTVTNSGDCALNVTAVDTLPANMTYVSSIPAGTQSPTGTITWDLGSIASGTPATTIYMVAHIEEGASGLLNNTVHVEGKPSHGDNVTDDDYYVITALGPAITVTKTGNVTEGAPSTDVNYTLTVTNSGDCALNVTAVDTLPANMTYVSSIPAGTQSPTGTITWDLGSIASGTPATTIYMVAHIEEGASGLLNNTVHVEGKPSHGDNVTDDDYYVITALGPAITVTKTGNVTEGAPSTDVNYTLTVTNSGDCALNVTAVDTLPANMTYVSSIPAGTQSPTGTITWDLGSIASGAPATTIYMVAHIEEGASGLLNNTVHVEGKPSHGDNVTDDDYYVITALGPAITVTKTGNVTEGAPSTDVNYTLTVTNSGDCALNVTAVDTLPANMTYVSSIPAGTQSPTGTITWDLGSIASGTPATTIYMVAHIEEGASGLLNNTVHVEGKPSHGDNVTDDDYYVITALGPAITVTKTGNVTEGAPSTDVNYTLTVTNSGDCALNVTAVDTLPANMTYVSSIPAGTQSPTGTITWDLGSIASGAPATTIYMVAHIEEGASGLLNNTVHVEGKPSHGDNVTDDDYYVITALGPAITVTKTGNVTEGAPSTDVNYTLTVTNSGDCALNVTAVDTLPANMTYVSSIPAGTQSPTGTITWDLGSIASGTPATTIYMVAHIEEGASGLLNNTVHVEGKPSHGDNVTDDDYYVITALGPAITVTKTGNVTEGAPSTDVNYTLTVTNSGDCALNVTAVDTLPANMTYVSSIPAGTQSPTGTITWDLGSIASGTPATTIYMVAHIEEGASGLLNNTVHVEGKPSHGDNVTDDDYYVITALGPAITVTKTGNVTEGAPSTDVNYTLTVTNSGDCALNVTAVDTLPANMTYVSSIPAGTQSPTGTITWDLGSIASGAPATTIYMVAHIEEGASGLLNNTVHVEGKPSHGDNVTDDDYYVITALGPAITVTKTGNVTEGAPSTDVNYTLTVTNSGDCALNVTAVDTLPANMTYVSSIPAGTQSPTGTITWDLGSIASGTPATTIYMVAHIEEGASGLLNNTVHVEGKPSHGDNVTDDDYYVITALGPAITVTKTGNVTEGAPSTDVNYTLTVTNSGDCALNVTAVDTLPANMTYVSSIPAGTQSPTGTITWDLGSIASGTPATTIYMVAHIEEGASGLLNNTVHVEGKPSHGDNVTDDDYYVITALGPAITVTKTGNVTEGAPSTDVNYTLTVTNSGDCALNVTAVDTLPANMTYVSSIPAGTQSPTGTITWDLGSIASGTPATTIYMVAHIEEGASGLLNNTVHVEGKPSHGDNVTDDDYYVITALGPAITVTKTGNVTEGAPSTDVNYTLTVTNSGDCALNVTAVDTLPANMTYVSSIPAGTQSPTGTITWDLGSIASGTPATTIYMVAHIEEGASGLLNNTVHVEGKPSHGDNVTDDDYYVITALGPAITVTKTGNVTEGAPSTDVNYTLTVTNSGDCALNVTAVDTLPANMTYVSSIPAGTQSPTGTITWDLCSIASGTPATTIYMVAHIEEGASGLLNNTVHVEGKPSHGDNVTDDDYYVITALGPAITVTKTGNVTEGAPSTDVNYTLTVTNSGDCALNVTAVDTLPANMTYVSSIPAGTQSPTGTITWDLCSIASGTPATTIYMVAHIEEGASGLLNNTVHVEGKPSHGDNVTDDDYYVITALGPAITVTKTGNVTEGAPSTDVNYTLTVTNSGDCALNVTAVDTLPANMTYVSSIPAGTQSPTGTITWDLGSIASGAPATTIYMVAHIEEGASGLLNNTVHVEGKPSHGDNVTDDDYYVITALGPAITVTKTGNVTEGAPSTDVNYTLTVTNSGDCALNVTAVDTLPANMTYVSSIPAGTQSPTGTITWDLGSIASGTPATTIYMVAHIEEGASGLLNNTVHVEGKPSHGDNVTDDDYYVITALGPAITVTKTGNVTEGAPSTDVNYTLTVTNSGDCALNVTAVDTLPANMTYVSSIPAGTQSPTGTITWDLGSIASGTPATTIYMVAHIEEGASGLLNNTVHVEGKPSHGDNVTDDDYYVITALGPAITVTKTGNVTEGAPSTMVNYTITVTNTGDSTLDVTAVDTIPTWMSYVSSIPAGTESPAGTVTWDLGSMASLGSTTVYMVAHVDTGASGVLNNTVHVEGKPSHGDNVTDDAYYEINALEPKISVNKTANPTAGPVGTDITFTINVTNTGNCTLNPVKVVDTLPTGMSYVSSSPTANTTGGTTIWNNVGPLNSAASTTITLIAHIDYGASGTLTDLVNATGTPPAGDNVTDSDTATVVVHPKPKPPIPPITRPQQAQYFSEKSSVQGVGEIFYEKTISASGVGVREYMWGNTGNGTFAMTITEILNEGVRLNCSGNCSDMGKIMDPIYGDDESPVMTNFECKKMVQFEIGAKDNPLIYGLEGEAIYSNPGFSGGMNAQVNEYYAVSSLQKDETVKMTTTATYNDTKRDWTNCQKARPYNANELNFDTKNAFTGSWGTDSSWTKVCSKDIKHHQYFEGEFQVDKNLMFQEEVTKPWPEKEPHGDC